MLMIRSSINILPLVFTYFYDMLKKNNYTDSENNHICV